MLKESYYDSRQLAKDSGLILFGATAGTLYYGVNYSNCIHADPDAGPTEERKDKGMMQPTFQALKKNCSKNEFGFVLVEYGIIIETETNCAW